MWGQQWGMEMLQMPPEIKEPLRTLLEEVLRNWKGSPLHHTRPAGELGVHRLQQDDSASESEPDTDHDGAADQAPSFVTTVGSDAEYLSVRE